MARDDVRTHLSLDRYAKIMGIAPVHFAGVVGSTVWPAGNSCQDVWPQYSWQHADVISRHDIAEAIYDAEEDIKRVLRRPVAPEWVIDDQLFPAASRRAFANNAIKIPTLWGDVIEGGVRAVSVIALNADAVQSDEDGDGYKEVMSVTVLAADLPSDFVLRETRVYFPGHGGHPAWEVRPVTKRVTVDGDLVVTFDSWLLIDPTLWEAPLTSAGFGPIDGDDPDSYLTTVDLYREYTDDTAGAVTYHWHSDGSCSCGGLGCTNCTPGVQQGCLTVASRSLGLVVPTPATYDEDSAAWVTASYAVSGLNPNAVTLRYRAGYEAQQYRQGLTDDPLDDYLAEAIAWLASARLESIPCTCGAVLEKFMEMRRDMAVVDRSRGVFFSVLSPDMITNPFGTRRGEVRAWNRVQLVMGEIPKMGGGAL